MANNGDNPFFFRRRSGRPTPGVPPGVEATRRLFAGFHLQETRAAHLGLLGTPDYTNGGPDGGSTGGGGACYCQRRAVPFTNPPGGNYSAPPRRQRPMVAHRSVFDLMVDRHGYRDFVDYVEASSYERLCEIVRVLARQEGSELLGVAKDDIGVMSLKSLIEKVKMWPGLWSPIAAAIGHRGTFELMKHTVGSRLVKHCLDHLKYAETKLVLDAASTFCLRLARHKTGYESLIFCIDKARLPLKKDIIKNLTEDCYILSTDKNYVINHVIENYGDRFYLRDRYYVSEVICFELVNSLEELSRHPYGSYVLQSCLQSSGGINLLRELARMDIYTLKEICEDRCGNYVLQTALNTNMDTQYHAWLVRSLSQLPKELLANCHARNVLEYIRNF